MKMGAVPKKEATGVTTWAILGKTRLPNPIDRPKTVPRAAPIRMFLVVSARWRTYPKQMSGMSAIRSLAYSGHAWVMYLLLRPSLKKRFWMKWEIVLRGLGMKV